MDAAETSSGPERTTHLDLGFDRISYTVRTGLLWTEKKKILANVTGDFRSGELSAIMGPSGAGKSTLLDILAGYRTSGVKGTVQVNGRPRNLAAFRRSSAYVMQGDNLQPLLTVQEVMHIAADLKLDTSSEEKKRGIDVILKEMGLDSVRQTCTKNLSGGQKKRLTIALELITNPPIMFFDEPTSGLDSVSSRQCLGLLQALAREGRTIICSIHQPSAILLDLIDHVYVIHEGHCAYNGGTKNLVPFLNDLDLQCPTHYNPADFLLEIVNGDYGDHVDRLVVASENGTSKEWRIPKINAAASKSTHNKTSELAQLELSPRLPLPDTAIFYEYDARGSAHYATSSLTQLRVLLRRNAIKLSRDRFLTVTRLSMHFALALFVGILFYNIGQDAAYAMDNFNLLFFTIMTIMYNAFNSTIITFPAEIPILMREHFNRWYKLHSVFIAHKLSDLPIQVMAVLLYTVTTYYLSGQISDFFRLGLFVTTCLFVSLLAQSIGLTFGTILDIKNGVIFGPLTIMPFMMFSGFFVHLNDAHPYLQWLFHISFFKYAFEAVMVAIYGYERPKMPCSKDYCHYMSPKKLLDAMDMKHSNYWFSTLILVGLYLGVDFIAYLVFRFRLRKR